MTAEDEEPGQPGDAAGQALRRQAGYRFVAAQRAFFRNSHGRVDSQWKADRSRVTEADLTLSRRLREAVAGDFPEDDFCTEEAEAGEQALRSRFAWIVDPIDGTNNYALGFPVCAISVALCENGWPVYGWVYDHAEDRILHGGRGYGLWEDDRHAPVLAAESGGDWPLALSFPVPAERLAGLAPFLTGHRFRNLGSSTMEGAYAALGQFAGVVDFRVRIWDIAAVLPLLEARGLAWEFLGPSPLPLRSFRSDAASVPYCGGLPATVAALRAAFGRGGGESSPAG
jgi:myo-inositol-1(or 4)-monophosphatase